MPWLEVSLELPERQVDDTSDALLEWGAVSVEVLPAEGGSYTLRVWVEAT